MIVSGMLFIENLYAQCPPMRKHQSSGLQLSSRFLFESRRPSGLASFVLPCGKASVLSVPGQLASYVLEIHRGMSRERGGGERKWNPTALPNG